MTDLSHLSFLPTSTSTSSSSHPIQRTVAGRSTYPSSHLPTSQQPSFSFSSSSTLPFRHHPPAKSSRSLSFTHRPATDNTTTSSIDGGGGENNGSAIMPPRRYSSEESMIFKQDPYNQPEHIVTLRGRELVLFVVGYLLAVFLILIIFELAMPVIFTDDRFKS